MRKIKLWGLHPTSSNLHTLWRTTRPKQETRLLFKQSELLWLAVGVQSSSRIHQCLAKTVSNEWNLTLVIQGQSHPRIDVLPMKNPLFQLFAEQLPVISIHISWPKLSSHGQKKSWPIQFPILTWIAKASSTWLQLCTSKEMVVLRGEFVKMSQAKAENKKKKQLRLSGTIATHGPQIQAGFDCAPSGRKVMTDSSIPMPLGVIIFQPESYRSPWLWEKWPLAWLWSTLYVRYLLTALASNLLDIDHV